MLTQIGRMIDSYLGQSLDLDDRSNLEVREGFGEEQYEAGKSTKEVCYGKTPTSTKLTTRVKLEFPKTVFRDSCQEIIDSISAKHPFEECILNLDLVKIKIDVYQPTNTSCQNQQYSSVVTGYQTCWSQSQQTAGLSNSKEVTEMIGQRLDLSGSGGWPKAGECPPTCINGLLWTPNSESVMGIGKEYNTPIAKDQPLIQLYKKQADVFRQAEIEIWDGPWSGTGKVEGSGGSCANDVVLARHEAALFGLEKIGIRRNNSSRVLTGARKSQKEESAGVVSVVDGILEMIRAQVKIWGLPVIGMDVWPKRPEMELGTDKRTEEQRIQDKEDIGLQGKEADEDKRTIRGEALVLKINNINNNKKKINKKKDSKNNKEKEKK
ncbi:hypothetical protein PPACK8108_LOCUS21588 [Phakopsora pachyrhizi]|uniref:Uncharacterized protein n=1 Tax=Phakopsora pachyrhizi TaxID=170000 RepID=A0AAV0BHR4_PHAPC|nr:hypothetical protein PPACK8108_LOCUS21588 [Phakopsora pachyrhizi]